jgi:peptidoglycan hydrolase-like protein with peptidoglycan-binding domain
MRKLLWTGGAPSFQHDLQWTGSYHGVDDAAKTWQQKMTDRTWAVNGVDGYFGPHCQELCREFQQRHGLQVDGIVGPVTWLMTWMAP